MKTTAPTTTPAPTTEPTKDITREDVYEEEIAPLVEKLARLCKRHDVPLLVVVQTDDRKSVGGETLYTTARIPGDAFPAMIAAFERLPREASGTTKTIAGKLAAVETHE
jgi:hypothetical protein